VEALFNESSIVEIQGESEHREPPAEDREKLAKFWTVQWPRVTAYMTGTFPPLNLDPSELDARRPRSAGRKMVQENFRHDRLR
jgi:hypothetical protein